MIVNLHTSINAEGPTEKLGNTVLPAFYDFFNRVLETFRDVPSGKVFFHFPQVGIVTDMVSLTVFVNIHVLHFFAADAFGNRKGFQDRACIVFSATQIVHLCNSWGLYEKVDKASYVVGMDVVAYLLAFVAVDVVGFSFQVTFDQVAQKSMKFYS